MTKFVRDREPLEARAGNVGRVKDRYPRIAEDDAAAYSRLVGTLWNDVDVLVFGDAVRIHWKCVEAMLLGLALSALARPCQTESGQSSFPLRRFVIRSIII